MSLEELVKKFTVMVSKANLTKFEQEEARQLMKELKKTGMTNDQISKLSKGKWTPSTVKFYTPGIKPSHPTPWDDVVELLDKLISSGLTLDDVETAVAVSEDFKSYGVSIDNVVDLLLAVGSSSLEMADLIHNYELLKEYGLSPKKMSEALSLKENLEEMGLGLDSLTPLLELAKNYGEPKKVIDALSGYKSLIELDQNIAAAKGNLDSVEKQLASRQEQVKSAEANLSKCKELIDIYEKIKQLGFGITELAKLSALAKKYGTAKKLMAAVDVYDTYSDVQDKLKKANLDLATSKANLQKLQSDNAHLKSAVTMCQTLIEKYTFGLDAIATIYSIAEKYGKPLNALKAIEAYGSLEAILKEKNKYQGMASEIEKKIAVLDGTHKEALQRLELLNNFALEVGSLVGRVQGEMTANDQIKKLIALIHEPLAADYADHISVVMVVALALKNWVTKNEASFKSYQHIKFGLDNLIKGLGGIP